MDKQEWYSVRIDASTMEHIRHIAQEEDRTLSSVIRRALAAYRVPDSPAKIATTPQPSPAQSSQADRLAIARQVIEPYSKTAQAGKR